MFIPATREEMERRGWDSLDVVIVSGDAYIDSPYNGAAIIGHWLIDHGFRVGLIPQPSLDSGGDVLSLGVPELFWSVTAGSVDSMVANYSPMRKFRKEDDFTPGGRNDRRPDRATIAYTNLIKRHSKGKPIVLGGVEASLRRVAHYDYWSDSVRRSVLFDAKADAITYGMGELSNLELARRMRDGQPWDGTDGVCVIGKSVPDGYLEMPSFEECRDSKESFMDAFETFHENCDPAYAKGLAQRHGDRYLIQNRPSRRLTTGELDAVHSLDYEYAVHPVSARLGHVRAMDTIRNSVTTHRGCYGGCSFCAVHAMQGRDVVSRSQGSIVAEVARMASAKGFDGVVRDVGGPTANMYGTYCNVGGCDGGRCLFPEPCPNLVLDHAPSMALLEAVRSVNGVRKAFVASGVRHDMVLADGENGEAYLRALCGHHISGQMKVAPEHVSKKVLDLMGKPGVGKLTEFKGMFDRINSDVGKRQFLTYYFMVAHPGCGDREAGEISRYCSDVLGIRPEQTQVFTPTPSTASTAMYHTGMEPFTRKPVAVEKSNKGKHSKKAKVVGGRGK
ncbi:MAG: YgiQ family radical SAM protein [Thermoplasmatales archaeon]|nr:YgiQ family radical SAM protein [Thermoplasmatales archaeon]